MAITNASRLADFGSGIGTAGAIIQVDNANQRVGIGITTPRATLDVVGVVSATSFYGTVPSENLSGALPALDGSALTNLNIPAGFTELDAALFN